MDKFDKVRQFKELLEQGAITQEEFERVKVEILGLSGVKTQASKSTDVKGKETYSAGSGSGVGHDAPDPSEMIEKKRLEEEKRIAEELAAKRAEEEKKLAEELAAKRAEEEKKLAEEMAVKRRAEEEKKLAEEMAAKRAEEEKKLAETIAMKRRAEEENRVEKEMAKRRAEEEEKLARDIESRRKEEEAKLAAEMAAKHSEAQKAVVTASASPQKDPADGNDGGGKKEGSPGKNNNSKKTLAIVLAVLCVAGIAGFLVLGGSNSQESSETAEVTDDAAGDTQEGEIEFNDANILSFELINTDNESFEDSIRTFKVTNNGKKAVDNISNISFSYIDKDGNEICTDGRYQPCQLQSGKSAFVESYSDLGDSYSKDDIDSVNITTYSYVIDKVEYTVDLQTETAETYVDDYTEYVDFDKANIIGFECNGKGVDSIDSYEVDVKVTNNGSSDADEVSYYLVYSNDNGDCLCNDGRYLENVLAAGKSANGTSYCTEEYSKDVSSFNVYSYEYKSLDSNSEYDYYVVNLQTKTAYGYNN